MAVQKSRKTRSTRGMRRSHDSLSASAVSEHQETGEVHRRHHITPDGYHHSGRQVIKPKIKDEEEDQE